MLMPESSTMGVEEVVVVDMVLEFGEMRY